MEISPGRAPFDVDDKYIPLRKPHIRENKKTAANSSTSTQNKGKSSSSLSATAQVFVPQSAQKDISTYRSGSNLGVVSQPQLVIQQSPLQNRILRNQHPNEYAALSCNPYQKGSVPASEQNHDKPTPDLNFNYLQPTEVETIALTYLATVIQCLNENPGSFDTVATRFLTIFDGMENNEYVLSNAMEDIFNQSIENSNFRYMGAKLYNLLHMLNLREDSLFHTLLKCKLDYHQAEVMEFMQNNCDQKVRETALFLAELYMQLRGDDSRIKMIAENIAFSLKQLLTKTTTDNIRCICFTLKLAGYDLGSDCPNDVNYVMQQLEVINKASPGKYPLVQNVISLKKNNWGRTTMYDHANLISPTSDSNFQASTEPTFYGPDGKILSEEESQFLSRNVPKSPSNEDDDEFDLDVDLDPEMDEETEKEYRKFCKQTR